MSTDWIHRKDALVAGITTILQSKALSALFILLIAAVSCRAENCPWLNAATASGALGGTVLANLVHTTHDDVTCEFNLKHNSDVTTLSIAVHTMTSYKHEFQSYRNACSTATTQLQGIGNEAIECSYSNQQDGQRQALSETIIARVRDRAFVLKWTFPPAGDSIPVISRDELQDRIRNLAEQVAGSLF
jgi:hypothetical protein